MSGINKVNVGNLDFKRISNNANSASNDDFLNESIIQKEYWGDENGEVDFVLRDDGTYTIEQDGVVMGFTDEQGYQNALKMNDDANVNDSIKNHSDKYYELHDPEQRLNRKNTSEETDTNLNDSIKNHSDKYYELHDPEQRLNRKNTSEETDTNLNDSIKSHSDKYYELHDPEQRLNRNKVVDGEGVAEVNPIKKMEPSYIGNATENILRNDRAKQWGLGQEIEFEYNGHKAHGHKYLDSSSTIYYVENGIKYWNRYDSKGNLTDVRMDDGKNQTIIYYENDAIVQKKIFPINVQNAKKTKETMPIGDLKKSIYNSKSTSLNRKNNESDLSSVVLDSSFKDVVEDGYTITSDLVNVENGKVIAASKDGDNSKLYFYDNDLNNCRELDLNFSDQIRSIEYGKSDNKVTLYLSNGDIKDYSMSDINSSINGPQSLAFATDEQLHLLDTARSIPSPGGGLCDAWTADVLDAAFPEIISDLASNEGISSWDVTHRYNARTAYNEWCTSSDLADLKVGMIVAVSTHDQTAAGSEHGHIGIYVGDIDGDGKGDIMDNIGYIRTEPLEDWINFYGGDHSPEPVKWGWRANVDLTK